jgi:MoaA/NifB/PqqE/SkfB family radical SAM enzyme
MLTTDRPIHSTIELTESCSLNCVHCYRCKPAAGPSELRTRELLSLFERLETMTILFEGGDPFERDDIFDLMAAATPRFATSLTTPGVRIDKYVARSLRELNSSAVYV